MIDDKDRLPSFTSMTAEINAAHEAAERSALRDQFACAAITGLADSVDEFPQVVERYPFHLARKAYAIADAMLAERDRRMNE